MSEEDSLWYSQRVSSEIILRKREEIVLCYQARKRVLPNSRHLFFSSTFLETWCKFENRCKNSRIWKFFRLKNISRPIKGKLHSLASSTSSNGWKLAGRCLDEKIERQGRKLGQELGKRRFDLRGSYSQVKIIEISKIGKLVGLTLSSSFKEIPFFPILFK